MDNSQRVLMETPPLLEIYTLGGLRLVIGGETVTRLSSSKGQALLVYLAVVNRPMARATLAELLWENRPFRRASSNLRVVLSALRSALAPYVHITRQTVEIGKENTCWLDVNELRDAASQASNEVIEGGSLRRKTAARLRRSFDLWQGDFLAGFNVRNSVAFEEWVREQQLQLQQSLLESVDRLIDFYIVLNEYGIGQELGERMLRLDPLRENTYRKLMLLSAYRGERILALDYYDACQRVLSQQLGIAPSAETVSLRERIKAGGVGPAIPGLRQGIFLSTDSGLVGRDKELSKVLNLLQSPDCRLLTLAGPGGIGKTRLAQAVIERLSVFPDGMHLVSVARAQNRAALIAAIAHDVGFPFQGRTSPLIQLTHYLNDKGMCLVLDGLEHVVGEARAVVEHLLRETDGVKILATSRERLGIKGEWLRQVPPLAWPDDPEAVDAESYPAVQLYLHFAKRVRSGFRLNEENAPAIIQICRHIGGNPLGIEMAAAWERMMPSAEIAREIKQDIEFLVAPHHDPTGRHQSMKAVFEHSWRLLTEKEKRTLAGLSVFTGGFSRQAATQVAGASFPLLSALIDKSLARTDLRGRYALHELVHYYTADKLAQKDRERVEAKSRHAAFYAEFVQHQERALHGRRRREAISQIEDTLGNIQQAWSWACAAGREELIHRMHRGLWHFYEAQNRYKEAVDVFADAAKAFADHRDSLVGALLHGCRGWFIYRTGYLSKGCALLEEGLEACRQQKGWPEVTFLLTLLGLVSNAMGAYERVRQFCQESLALSEDVGDAWGRSVSLNVLGNVSRRLGEFEAARQFCQQSLALSQASGDRLGAAISQNDLGRLAFCLGDYAEAETHCRDSLELSTELGDQLGVAISLDRLGNVAQALGDYEQANAYYQRSLAASRSIGDQLGVAISMNYLSSVACVQQEVEKALQLSTEALAVSRHTDNLRGIIFSLNHCGRASFLANDLEQALAYYEEGRELAEEQRAMAEEAMAWNGLADIMAQQEDTMSRGVYVTRALVAAREANQTHLLLHTLLRVGSYLVNLTEHAAASSLISLALNHPGSWQETRLAAQHVQKTLQVSAAKGDESPRGVIGKPSSSLQEVADQILLFLSQVSQ